MGGKKRFNKSKESTTLTKKQRSDLKEFGELHPSDIKEDAKNIKYTKIVEESDDDEGEEIGENDSSEEERMDNPYQKLINSFANNGNKSKSKYESSDESDDESDDEVSSDDIEDGASHMDQKNIENDADSDDSNSINDDSDIEDNCKIEEKCDKIEKNDLIKCSKDNGNQSLTNIDPFKEHFETDITEELASHLVNKPKYKISEFESPYIGKYQHHQVEFHSNSPDPPIHKNKNLTMLHFKEQLSSQISSVNNKADVKLKENEKVTSLQASLLSVLSMYQDILYPNQTFLNKEEIRVAYCVHALNHCLKTRSRIVHHNEKLKANTDDNLEFRDQGFSRPKVLILVPFRDSAYRIINTFIEFLKITDQSMVMNRKRFIEEFLQKNTESTGKKPEDFQETFSGNIDDHFRIGLSIAKKTLKLYTEFYTSDVIIASPLGLRTIIGAEGEEKRDYDFLSSIEILIMDQTDIFMMQNWEHVHQIMKHLHLQPQEPRETDFSRIRMWTLNGWSKYYRQTIIFSNIYPPEIVSLMSKHCCNFAGKVIVPKFYMDGSVAQIVTALPQVFKRIKVNNFSEACDARFQFFKDEILPEYMQEMKANTFIFVSSYFDFVRIRNYMKKENIDFFTINEYTKESHISTARSMFFHKKTHFIVYTERVHFYRRFLIKGIRHLLFYQLPNYGKFYEEICNALSNEKSKDNDNTFTCTVLYTRYDSQRLSAVVGSNRAAQIINSDKETHLLLTGTS